MTKIEQTSKKHKNVFKRVFSLFDKTQKTKAIFALILVAISASCDLAIPSIMSTVMDPSNMVPIPGTDKIDVNAVPWYLFGVMGGLALASILVQMASVWFVMGNMTKTSSMLRTRIFTKTRYLSSKDINDIGQGTILTITTNDVTQLEQFLANYNSTTVKSIFFALGGLGLSIYQLTKVDNEPKIWYATISYAFIILIIIFSSIIMIKAIPNFKKARTAVDDNNMAMQENIIGAKLIRTLNIEKLQAKKYNKGNSILRQYLTNSEKVIAIMVPIASFFLNAAMLTIYLVGGFYSWWSYDPQTMEIVGVIFAFSQYLALMLLGFILIAGFGYTISRAKVSSQRIFNLLDKENSIQEAKNPKKISNGNIELKNVSFKYTNEDEKYALKNLNINVKSGESIGVIGQTGSGKSSLVKILTRLYDVSSGEVIISGHNIKDISFDSLQQDIAVSLQEKVILSGTYKSNIKIGKPKATDKEVLAAAKAAEAWEFISNKEKQLDGIVEERGSNLSGGQKQRLAIARALVKNPKILIFDDSTSALDTITEKKIMTNISKSMKDATKIIISQKVKSIKNCDQIFVFDNGKIVQHGTHNQLIKDKNGIYARIHESQNTSLEG